MSYLKRIPVLLYPVLVFLFVWGGSLATCEFLTWMHGTEFSEEYKKNSMLSEMEFLKVINYTRESATIYFISKGFTDAHLLAFVKINGQWQYDEWVKTVWSVSGTADEVIWPYWWHVVYANQHIS
jgi:hypothetical protein